MTSLLGRVAPGLVAKLNLLVDLLALVIATVLIPYSAGHVGSPSPALIYFAVVAPGVWVVVATALRHYDPAARRAPFDDAAMVAVLAIRSPSCPMSLTAMLMSVAEYRSITSGRLA